MYTMAAAASTAASRHAKRRAARLTGGAVASAKDAQRLATRHIVPGCEDGSDAMASATVLHDAARAVMPRPFGPPTDNFSGSLGSIGSEAGKKVQRWRAGQLAAAAKAAKEAVGRSREELVWNEDAVQAYDTSFRASTQLPAHLTAAPTWLSPEPKGTSRWKPMNGGSKVEVALRREEATGCTPVIPGVDGASNKDGEVVAANHGYVGGWEWLAAWGWPRYVCSPMVRDIRRGHS